MYVRAPAALIPSKHKILNGPETPVFMVCGKEKLMTRLLLSPYPAFNLDLHWLDSSDSWYGNPGRLI